MSVFQKVIVVTYIVSLLFGTGTTVKRHIEKKILEKRNERLQEEIENQQKENEKLEKEIEQIEDWRVQKGLPPTELGKRQNSKHFFIFGEDNDKCDKLRPLEDTKQILMDANGTPYIDHQIFIETARFQIPRGTDPNYKHQLTIPK